MTHNITIDRKIRREVSDQISVVRLDSPISKPAHFFASQAKWLVYAKLDTRVTSINGHIADKLDDDADE